MRGSYKGKRLVDWTILLGLAPPALVTGLFCAAAVKLGSRGPIFFRQERIGLHGKSFRIFKFRTMIDADNPLFPDPSRITKVGAVLRRLSLDELPQLINVARGEMSIVGPRPTLRYQVERYTDRQRQRLAIRPGVTGLAQVRGRNEVPWAERIEMDLEYVAKQSIWMDLKILILSLTVVVGGGGVEGHPTDDPLAAEIPDPPGSQ